MKKLSALVFVLFLLNSCGEPPKKIYSKDGMFKDKK